MTVAYTYNLESRATYEAVAGEVMGASAPSGLIVHAAGEEKDGKWRVIEVWEDDETRGQWEREHLFPALQRHGIDTSEGPPPWVRVDVKHLVKP